MHRFFQDAESDSERTVAAAENPATPASDAAAARAKQVEFGDMEDDSVSVRGRAAFG
jgi:hypothetical protein